jgi:hypothetical protein
MIAKGMQIGHEGESPVERACPIGVRPLTLSQDEPLSKLGIRSVQAHDVAARGNALRGKAVRTAI